MGHTGDRLATHGIVLQTRRETRLACSRTRVPGIKGASLLYMIPLERWNVERSVAFCGKREVTDVSSTSSLLSNRLSGTELILRSTDLLRHLERGEEVVSGCKLGRTSLLWWNM